MYPMLTFSLIALPTLYLVFMSDRLPTASSHVLLYLTLSSLLGLVIGDLAPACIIALAVTILTALVRKTRQLAGKALPILLLASSVCHIGISRWLALACALLCIPAFFNKTWRRWAARVQGAALLSVQVCIMYHLALPVGVLSTVTLSLVGHLLEPVKERLQAPAEEG